MISSLKKDFYLLQDSYTHKVIILDEIIIKEWLCASPLAKGWIT